MIWKENTSEKRKYYSFSRECGLKRTMRQRDTKRTLLLKPTLLDIWPWVGWINDSSSNTGTGRPAGRPSVALLHHIVKDAKLMRTTIFLSITHTHTHKPERERQREGEREEWGDKQKRVEFSPDVRNVLQVFYSEFNWLHFAVESDEKVLCFDFYIAMLTWLELNQACFHKYFNWV